MTSIIDTLKRIIKDVLIECHINRIHNSVKYIEDRRLAFILRNVHSIEKGLSLASPKKGFGYAKVIELLDSIEQYHLAGNDMKRDHIFMAADAITEYLAYHKSIKYEDRNLLQIAEKFNSINAYIPDHSKKYGGTIEVKKGNYTLDEKELVKGFLLNRHSVRQFREETINTEDIKAAVELAYRAPSACNRQATRVYIVPKDKAELLRNWTEGIGGFNNDIDTFILITAKQSYYYPSEHFQYIVTASILAGYLALTLELYDIGSCVLQRPVGYSKKWNDLRKTLGIPEDEQIITFLGCGLLKDTYKVPVSNRLGFDEIGRVIEQ